MPRFDALSYVVLTELMDSHDLGRHHRSGMGGRTTFCLRELIATCEGDPARTLQNISIPALVIGIDSDILYPLSMQVGIFVSPL